MDALNFFSEQMQALEINYEFGEWTSEAVYPYFVGEITESPTHTEDGKTESTVILTGFHRGSFIDLETVKEKIKKHFNPICGRCAKTGSGSIAVFFDGSFYIPTGEANLRKIQINLKVMEWKGVL